MTEADAIDAILEVPPCTPADAAENAERIRVRNRRVLENQGLVASVARKFARSRVPFEELMQLGQLGLIRAAEDHDPARGGAFSTIATYRIYTAIAEGLAQDCGAFRVPDWARRLLREYRARERALEAAKGRPVARDEARDEVCDAMGLDPGRREVISRALGAQRTGGTNVLEFDLPGDDETDDGADHPELRKALRHLPAPSRQVLERRYGLDGGGGMTQEELGRELGVTASAISFREVRALEKLRAMLA